jgi:predicted transposase/invertase (TIGR01784 family)
VDIDIENMNGKEVRAMLEAKLQEFEEEAFQRGELKGTLKGTLKVAKALYERGMTREEVIEVTGLSEKELNELDSEK